MARYSVYYDSFDDKLCPIWMIVYFEDGELNWKENLFIPIDAPFERKMSEDFNDDQLSLSITLSELFVNEFKTGHIGINLAATMRRLNVLRGQKYTPDFLISDIEQFVIQMCDIEEVLQMDRNKFYSWK